MSGNVTYRELTEEMKGLQKETQRSIKNLSDKVDKRFDGLEECLDSKVDTSAFRRFKENEYQQLEEDVLKNRSFITKVSGAIAIIVFILGFIGKWLLGLITGG